MFRCYSGFSSMSFESSCDICLEEAAIEAPYVNLYTNGNPVHICANCGFVYIKKRRNSDEIARVWEKEIYQHDYTAIQNPAVIARQVYVAEFLAKNINLSGKLLADIGAGEGNFLEYVHDKFNANVFGIEPSTANCSRMNANGIRCFDGTIEKYVSSDSSHKNQIDVATVMWTLENCASCVDFMIGVNQLLKIGGHVVIATGSRIMVPFKKPMSMYFSKTPMDSHLYRFTFNSLKNLLSMTGFTLVESNRYVDSDVMALLAVKHQDCLSPDRDLSDFSKDHPLLVYDFFERWHKESNFHI